MNVNKLTLEQLNHAVARAQGWINYPTDSIEHGDTWYFDKNKAPFCRFRERKSYKPTEDWGQLGPLLDKFYIELHIGDEYYFANRTVTSKYDEGYKSYAGITYQEAACRAIVASVYGEEISEDVYS